LLPLCLRLFVGFRLWFFLLDRLFEGHNQPAHFDRRESCSAKDHHNENRYQSDHAPIHLADAKHVSVVLVDIIHWLVEVSVEGMNLTRNIYLARNRRQSLTRAQAKFWEFVTSTRNEIQNSGQTQIRPVA